MKRKSNLTKDVKHKGAHVERDVDSALRLEARKENWESAMRNGPRTCSARKKKVIVDNRTYTSYPRGAEVTVRRTERRSDRPAKRPIHTLARSPVKDGKDRSCSELAAEGKRNCHALVGNKNEE